jgi:hypothetical protein
MMNLLTTEKSAIKVYVDVANETSYPPLMVRDAVMSAVS